MSSLSLLVILQTRFTLLEVTVLFFCFWRPKQDLRGALQSFYSMRRQKGGLEKKPLSLNKLFVKVPYTHPQHFGKKQAWHQHRFCYDLCARQVKLPCSFDSSHPVYIPGYWQKDGKTYQGRKSYQSRREREKSQGIENKEKKLDLTVSFVGARISSIIILSRAKELRLSVLDLSELKERRLHVTTQPSAAGNNKWRAGAHDIKQKARNPLLHATSREPRISLDRESPKVENREKRKEPAVEQGSDTAGSYSEMEMRVRSVCLHWEIEAERTRLKHYFCMKVCITDVTTCV